MTGRQTDDVNKQKDVESVCKGYATGKRQWQDWSG